MLISRGRSLLNIGLKCIKQAKVQPNVQLQTVRNHGAWFYRAYNVKPEAISQRIADVISGIAWWWLLWHFWHDSTMITGEEPFPDPSLWTDEELGIPPDDVD